MTHTLTLGPLVLVGMQQGTVVRVSVRSQLDTCDVFLTIPEWSSLKAEALAYVEAKGKEQADG